MISSSERLLGLASVKRIPCDETDALYTFSVEGDSLGGAVASI